MSCFFDEYWCCSGECLLFSFVCDFCNDCLDGLDEDVCKIFFWKVIMMLLYCKKIIVIYKRGWYFKLEVNMEYFFLFLFIEFFVIFFCRWFGFGRKFSLIKFFGIWNFEYYIGVFRVF